MLDKNKQFNVENKYIKFAKKYSQIGKDKYPNIDFGEILRNGREEFRKNFYFKK